MEHQIAEILSKRTPRETSGSQSSNRFDFQKDWILCQILDLHLSGKDYIVICDYHEDVIILSNGDEPASASFLQIKTKIDKCWRMNDLIKRKKGRDGAHLSSILGKLYNNYLILPMSTVSLHFVSNATFDIMVNNHPSSKGLLTIDCRQLEEPEIKKIKQKLSEECNTDCTLPNSPLLFFEVTSLSVTDHAVHTKGRIAEFLETFAPGKKHSITPIYRTLFDEVRRKTNHEYICPDVDELKSKKSIGRKLIDDLLAQMKVSSNPDLLWPDVYAQLSKEEFSIWEIQRIHAAWETYEIHRMDATNDILQELRTNIIFWCTTIKQRNSNVSLRELMNETWNRVQDMVAGKYQKEFIFAIALLETYENI